MSNVPLARVKLAAVRQSLLNMGRFMLADDVEEIIDLLYRKPPISRAKPRIRKLTPELAEAIRATHRFNPELSQLEIARIHDTNPGRVSEALNNKV